MDNIIINNKQFIYTLCSNLYNYLNTYDKHEKNKYLYMLIEFKSILDSTSNIYDILDNITNNMHEYNKTIITKHDNNYSDDFMNFNNDIYAINNIESDYKRLKEILLTEQEQKQIEEVKKLDNKKNYNNEDINRLQNKYTRVIAGIFYNVEVVEIRLIDGEKIELKNNDRLLII